MPSQWRWFALNSSTRRWILSVPLFYLVAYGCGADRGPSGMHPAPTQNEQESEGPPPFEDDKLIIVNEESLAATDDIIAIDSLEQLNSLAAKFTEDDDKGHSREPVTIRPKVKLTGQTGDSTRKALYLLDCGWNVFEVRHSWPTDVLGSRQERGATVTVVGTLLWVPPHVVELPANETDREPVASRPPLPPGTVVPGRFVLSDFDIVEVVKPDSTKPIKPGNAVEGSGGATK